MKSLTLTILFCLIFLGIAFAEIPIYCPHCKIHLYDYAKDVDALKNPAAGDFRTVDIRAMLVTDNLSYENWLCPYDGAPLNGWLYWAKSQDFKSFSMVYPALSVLTKDENGKWLWIPYSIPSGG